MASLLKLFSPNVLLTASRGFVAQNPGFATTQIAFFSQYSQIVQKLGIPDKPKQPRTAFIHYLDDVRASIKFKKPKDLFVQAGVQWNQLTTEEKEKYYTEFKKESAEYRQLYDEYKKNLTPEQEKAIKTERKLLKDKRAHATAKKTLKTELQALGKPKKPMSAYACFVKDKCTDSHLRASDVKNEWEQLSDEQKQVYKNKYIQLRDTHQAELKIWEDKMLLEDKGHLVRKKRFVVKNGKGVVARKPRGKDNKQKAE
ncbi:transcription factor A, mitochondrial-like [Contarinia nasturtii]|uniref:transcription factor A, mitochondrial-like n=1 Tax=Contarinia nasturtii TaxID=265458 RepID=UPI0012D3E122|nr:transcription factor A, mitochondrial-like [Contarinia nasturtii]